MSSDKPAAVSALAATRDAKQRPGQVNTGTQAHRASQVVECHGTFFDHLGRPTIMEQLCTPRLEGDVAADAPQPAPAHASPEAS